MFLKLEQQSTGTGKMEKGKGKRAPWVHLVHASVLQKLPVLDSVDLVVHGDTADPTWRSIHAALPRTLPLTFNDFYRLHLSDQHLRTFTDLMRLVGTMPRLRYLKCTRIAWGGSGDEAPAAFALRRTQALWEAQFVNRQESWPAFRLLSWELRADLPDLRVVASVIRCVLSGVPGDASGVTVECNPLAAALANKSVFEHALAGATALRLVSQPSAVERSTGFTLTVRYCVKVEESGTTTTVHRFCPKVEFRFTPSREVEWVIVNLGLVVQGRREDVDVLSDKWEEVDQLSVTLPALRALKVQAESWKVRNFQRYGEELERRMPLLKAVERLRFTTYDVPRDFRYQFPDEPRASEVLVDSCELSKQSAGH